MVDPSARASEKRDGGSIPFYAFREHERKFRVRKIFVRAEFFRQARSSVFHAVFFQKPRVFQAVHVSENDVRRKNGASRGGIVCVKRVKA